MLENFLPALQLASEWFIDFPVAMGFGIIPKTVVAMPIIQPAGVIQNRVKAHAVDRHSTRDGRLRFLADISKPTGPDAIFRTRFRDEDGSMISLIDFSEHFAKWLIARVVSGD